MDIPPPNQISYEEVCQQVGKIFLESKCEIDRLSIMLAEAQKKINEYNQEKIKLTEQLKVAQQRIAQFEADFTLLKATTKVKDE